MVKVGSLFGQLLAHFPRTEFAALVKEHGAERGAKGFTCWTQMVSMLFCQLGRADSLREICNGLRCCLGKLVHVGIGKAPSKSTLAYANEHRPAALYQDLFYRSLHYFRNRGGLSQRPGRFRFKNKLLSFDSTTISLCLALFPWAKFRRAKGGVKVHVLLDHDHYLPTFVHISEARCHDIAGARLLTLNPGSVVAMDRGYNDYSLFGSWTSKGIFFVTRLKDNASYRIIETRTTKGKNILVDQIIRLTGAKAEQRCPFDLRMVVVWDPLKEREIVLLTNHGEFAAPTIAAIYKERWQIEIFFKALKQTLTVKSFVGTSENALRIQIWTALIAMLLIKWLHHLSRARWSLSIMASMLRLNLFAYRDLLEWLRDPFGLNQEAVLAAQSQQELPGFGQATA
jgi:hypothetical protein